jgi:hypothetical protein
VKKGTEKYLNSLPLQFYTDESFLPIDCNATKAILCSLNVESCREAPLFYHPVLALILSRQFLPDFPRKKNNMVSFVLAFYPLFWPFPFVPRGQDQTSLPTPLFLKLAYNGSPLFFIHWCDAFYIIFLPCFKIKIIKGAMRWERDIFR